MKEPVNLLNFNHDDLAQFFISIGEKPMRATQVMRWMHFDGVDQFAQMTNLSKSLREKLSAVAVVKAPEIFSEHASSDGTYKWILKLDDNNAVETVFIPEGNRGTLCVSSQVGCVLNCQFCSTGHQGFNRNLTVAEIIGQVWVAARRLSSEGNTHDRHVTNVVMMGMGEPLLNFDHVVKAMNIMMNDHAYGLSKRRVTLSTSGVVPAMKKLKALSDVSLAVSLHAPNDQLRSQIMPINKKYPLKELLAVCKDYYKNEPRRKITFEYVMLKGINDLKEHAYELIHILRGIPAKVNLIPFNPFPQSHYETSSKQVINQFRDILMRAGLMTVTRKTRGDDIDAACGQLVGKVKDRTRRQQQYAIEQIPIIIQ